MKERTVPVRAWVVCKGYSSCVPQSKKFPKTRKYRSLDQKEPFRRMATFAGIGVERKGKVYVCTQYSVLGIRMRSVLRSKRDEKGGGVVGPVRPVGGGGVNLRGTTSAMLWLAGCLSTLTKPSKS